MRRPQVDRLGPTAIRAGGPLVRETLRPTCSRLMQWGATERGRQSRTGDNGGQASKCNADPTHHLAVMGWARQVEARSGTMDATLLRRRSGACMVWHRLLLWLWATAVERPHGKDEAMSIWATRRLFGRGLPATRATLVDTETTTGASLGKVVAITDKTVRGKMQDPPNLPPISPSLIPVVGRVAMEAGRTWAEGPRTTVAAHGPAGAVVEWAAAVGAHGVATEDNTEADTMLRPAAEGIELNRDIIYTDRPKRMYTNHSKHFTDQTRSGCNKIAGRTTPTTEEATTE